MAVVLPKIKPSSKPSQAAIDAAIKELSRPCWQLMLGAYTRGILEHRIDPPDWKPIETGILRSSMSCTGFEKVCKVKHNIDRQGAE